MKTLQWTDVTVLIADCHFSEVRRLGGEVRLFGPDKYHGAFPVDGWPQSDIGLSPDEALHYGIVELRK